MYENKITRTPPKDRFQDDCKNCGYQYNLKRDASCRNCKKKI